MDNIEDIDWKIWLNITPSFQLVSHYPIIAMVPILKLFGTQDYKCELKCKKRKGEMPSSDETPLLTFESTENSTLFISLNK